MMSRDVRAIRIAPRVMCVTEAPGEAAGVYQPREPHVHRSVLFDRREGRCLVSYEADGEWLAVSKSVLTYVIGQGQDALITDIGPKGIEVLRLTCPGVVVLS